MHPLCEEPGCPCSQAQAQAPAQLLGDGRATWCPPSCLGSLGFWGCWDFEDGCSSGGRCGGLLVPASTEDSFPDLSKAGKVLFSSAFFLYKQQAVSCLVAHKFILCAGGNAVDLPALSQESAGVSRRRSLMFRVGQVRVSDLLRDHAAIPWPRVWFLSHVAQNLQSWTVATCTEEGQGEAMWRPGSVGSADPPRSPNTSRCPHKQASRWVYNSLACLLSAAP